MGLPAATSINQLAYVVKDLDEAIVWWNDVMGVGPFVVLRDLPFESSDYRGQDVALSYGAAIAFSGEVMVELIQPYGPSIFDEYLKAGKNGVQHICVFTDDFDATVSAIEARGARRLQGGRIMGGIIGYYEMGGDQAVILEVAQLAPDGKAMFAALKEAGRNWDGKTRHWLPG